VAEDCLKNDQPERALDFIVKAKSFKLPVRSLDHTRACCFLKMNMPADTREALREELRYFPDNKKARELLKSIDPGGEQENSCGMPDAEFQRLFAVVRPYTMLSEARLYSIYRLAKDICQKGIPGNFVECGVAAGGSTAVMAYVAKRYSKQPRLVHSFDSFEGMPEPTEHDVHEGAAANSTGWGVGTCSASEESVREICSKVGVLEIVSTGKGYFQDTLPRSRDKTGMIAFLHLDADWYDSTKVILNNLYDRIVNDGVLQVDDYGYWEGCRKAIHEFETLRQTKFDIRPIDGTGVWFTKPERFPVNPGITPALVREFLEDDPDVQQIESQMSQNERFQMYYLLRTFMPPGRNGQSHRFVEIGSYAGASLYLTCRALLRTGKSFQGFAVEPGGKPQFYSVLNQFSHNVFHVKLLSSDAAPPLRHFFDKDGDLPGLISVDGDHTYEGVKQDILNYYPLLASGGIMIFHDYLPPLDEHNKEAILYHHAGKEPGIRRACEEIMEMKYGCKAMDIPLLCPADPTQTQAHLPIIPGVYSTIRAYRKQ
jgi:macrocin-O-methyltransferase TylF-like protien/methyltransferase family protein